MKFKFSEDCKYCANFYDTHCWHCRHVTYKVTDGDYCCKRDTITPNYLAYVRAMQFISKLTPEEKNALATAFNLPVKLLWSEIDEIDKPQGDWVVPDKEPL